MGKEALSGGLLGRQLTDRAVGEMPLPITIPHDQPPFLQFGAFMKVGITTFLLYSTIIQYSLYFLFIGPDLFYFVHLP